MEVHIGEYGKLICFVSYVEKSVHIYIWYQIHLKIFVLTWVT